MIDYYMLACFSPPGAFLARVEYRDKRFWNSGKRFEDAPTAPLSARVVMKERSVLPEMLEAPLPLMSVRLHRALLAAGVANIDAYPLNLVDKQTGAVLSTEHCAFNLIGVASIVDLEKSKFDLTQTDRLIAMNIDSLVLKSEDARGALMFRLAEAVSSIVVHRSVKTQIEAAGIDTISFIEPEDWAA